MTTIAVIGDGFSGALLRLHLLRRCPPPTRLVLIERNSQFDPGLACRRRTENPAQNGFSPAPPRVELRLLASPP